MKKQILIGSAVLTSLAAYSQNGRIKPSGRLNMSDIVAQKFAMDPDDSNAQPRLNTPAVENSASAEKSSNVAAPPTQISWKAIAGSMNVYGMLVSSQRTLQYNNNVNAISFIHRKSATYTANPSGNSNSGTIVAEISSNWGATWDSTAVWASSSNVGRYPQGGIYNPPGNSNIANAYVVATGPTTDGASLWTGSFYASKQLNAFNNTPDQTAGAQQLLPLSGTAPAGLHIHGWSRYGFTSTDDGLVRSLALVQGDNQTLGSAAQMRGVAVVKGTFNAGTFTWTSDTLSPDAIVSGGAKHISSGPQMAWNESGTVGYVVIIGGLNSATGSNRGYQPIVYKTINSGATWTQLTGIDFNDPSMNVVTDHLATVSSSATLTIPYFIDFDLTVDKNDKLHIGALIISTYSSHNDSIDNISVFSPSSNPNDQYYWLHAPGSRPYVYDFIGDGTAPWSVMTIDSLSTQDPGASTTSTGYADNPWDPTGTGNAKVNMDARLQLGRTPNGDFITFSWADSDTNFTQNAKKYNTIPNITTRCMMVGASGYSLSPTELNATKYSVSQGTNNPQVNSRATLHYMSPTTTAATITCQAGTEYVDIFTPMTVTNSNPYSQLTNNVTWFGSAKLSYAFGVCTGMSSNNKFINASLFPNPSSENSTVSIMLEKPESVKISVYNAIGQLVLNSDYNGTSGVNNFDLNTASLQAGVYLVSVETGSNKGTLKFIKQ